MIKWLREFRLIPLALVGVGSLLALKVTGLILDGGYTLGQRLNRSETMVVTTVPATSAVKLRSETVPLDIAVAQPSKPWAQEMLNYPEVTGSVPAAKPPETKPAASVPVAEPPKQVSAAERAVLERLQERRQQLDARARELDMRESLLKAAEKRLEAKLAELKDVESRVNAAMGNRDKAEAERFKGIVSMYENMKAKDAARIFDRLDLKILVEVATQINARKMAEILSLMSSESAERLTVELANRASSQPKSQNPDQLPKIEGKPSGT